MRALLLSTLLMTLSLSNSPLARAEATGRSVPAPPTYGVLDEAHVLSAESLRALETLLTEHDRLAGEQIVIALFKDLKGENPVDFTQKVFKTWGVGLRGKNTGILLALYWDDQKARIEVGFGLEASFPEGKADSILDQFLVPELRRNEPYRGLSLTTLEILRILESPLIADGKAQQIIQAGGFSGPWQPSARLAPGSRNLGMLLWLLAGLIFALGVLNRLVNADIHYTSRGWLRTSMKPSDLFRKKRKFDLAGGASGSW